MVFFWLHGKEFDVLFMTLIVSKQLCGGDVSLYVVIRILCQDPTLCGILVSFLLVYFGRMAVIICSLFPFLLHVTYTQFAAPIIDGHQKLIRWGMVTHAAIDGFSRLMVYMKCSNTN